MLPSRGSLRALGSRAFGLTSCRLQQDRLLKPKGKPPQEMLAAHTSSLAVFAGSAPASALPLASEHCRGASTADGFRFKVPPSAPAAAGLLLPWPPDDVESWNVVDSRTGVSLSLSLPLHPEGVYHAIQCGALFRCCRSCVPWVFLRRFRKTAPATTPMRTVRTRTSLHWSTHKHLQGLSLGVGLLSSGN